MKSLSLALSTYITSLTILSASPEANAFQRENDALWTVGVGAKVTLLWPVVLPANSTSVVFATTKGKGARSEKSCDFEFPTSTKTHVLPMFKSLEVSAVSVESDDTQKSVLFEFKNAETIKLRCYENIPSTTGGYVKVTTDKFSIWKLRGVLWPKAALNLEKLESIKD